MRAFGDGQSIIEVVADIKSNVQILTNVSNVRMVETRRRIRGWWKWASAEQAIV